MARGGGSLEDLWAFNEEIVVRAAANSRIPLISAVGHETDTTLIDFVADRRAPTPTAAAEMAVPVRAELLAWVKEQDGRLYKAVQQRLAHRGERVAGLSRGLPRPEALLAQAAQGLDERAQRLALSLPRCLQRKRDALEKASAGLNFRLLIRQLHEVEQGLTHFGQRAGSHLHHRLQREEARLSAATRLLESLNYTQVLARGYAIVRHREGGLVTSAAQARGPLVLTFADGEAKALGGDA